MALNGSLSVNLGQCRGQIPHHLTERGGECRPPTDKHIIMSRTEPLRSRIHRHPHHLPQAAAYPVAFHGIAYLPRYGKAYTHRIAFAAPESL